MGTPSGPRSGPEAAQDIADRYLARGSSFSSGLPGAWAAVIEDGASGRIVLAQDPLGIETIYFRKEVRELIVAAETLPLVAGSPPDAVCEEYFADLFAFGTPNRALTPFRDVRRLAHGETILVDGAGEHRQTPWHPETALPAGSANDLADRLRQLVDEAVASAVGSGDSALCELSGGLDSSTVFMAADRRCENLQALTTVSSVATAAEDEDFARIAGEATGRPWHRIDLDQAPLCSLAPFGRASEPDGEMRGAVQAAYASVVRETSPDVVLTGAAGDIVFGYGGLRPAHLADAIGKGSPVTAWRNARRWSRNLDGARSALSLIRQTSLPLWQGYRDGVSLVHRGSQPAWLSQAFASRHRFAGRRRARAAPTVDRIGQQYLWDLIYELAGQAQPSFRRHLFAPSRHPLLHLPLVEFMLALPPDLRAVGADDRRLQRQALRDRLPEAIRTRYTKGTSQERSERDLMKSEPWWRAMTDDPRLVSRGWVDPVVWRRTIEGVRLGIYDGSLNLEAAMIAELWLRRLEE
jgi:asparagine synthase (glutamine-hydrolysing)|tara:strand:+ start:83102 stop:84670 length:1569 start_codon:yes stop_codon:yes gene_type:complete